MFTGLVEEVGTVESMLRTSGGARITVAAPIASATSKIGDSIAISGACLTVVGKASGSLCFEAVPETLAKTTLGSLRNGDAVNIERSLAVGDRLGGHFVQGHVDGVGELVSVEQQGMSRLLRFRVPVELCRYISAKGSIAVDGISLTVVDALDDGFSVSIIPHTWDATNLASLGPRASVNVETDMLAKYLARLMEHRPENAADSSSALESALIAGGFAETLSLRHG